VYRASVGLGPARRESRVLSQRAPAAPAQTALAAEHGRREEVTRGCDRTDRAGTAGPDSRRPQGALQHARPGAPARGASGSGCQRSAPDRAGRRGRLRPPQGPARACTSCSSPPRSAACSGSDQSRVGKLCGRKRYASAMRTCAFIGFRVGFWAAAPAARACRARLPRARAVAPAARAGGRAGRCSAARRARLRMAARAPREARHRALPAQATTRPARPAYSGSKSGLEQQMTSRA